MGLPAKLMRYLPMVIGALLSAVVVYFLVQLFLAEDDGEPVRKQTVQKVTILTPPPPPPPPPKIEEPPPEPEVQEEVDIPEPEDVPDVPDAPPMGDDLGIDADGSGAGDGFGLVGRRGGRGLLDGDPHAAFGAKVQKLVEDLLVDNEQIRTKAYSVPVSIWVNDDGSIRAKLRKSTGDEVIDEALIELLTTTVLASGPPIDMPMPIRIRVSSRM